MRTFACFESLRSQRQCQVYPYCDNNFIKILGLFDSIFYIYSNFASSLSTGQELLPFLQACCQKQRLRHLSVWSNEKNNVYGNIPYGAMKETTFTATFRMEQRKKQRLRQHSVWSNERNNVYGNIPYGAMKETTFTATFHMEQ